MSLLVDNLSYELGELREALREKETRADRVRLLHQLSGDERLLAIALLLAEADTAGFFEHLALSGEARKQLLLLTMEGARGGRFVGTSHVQPFFDALVARKDALARELARLSLDQWLQGEEYEEDFLYARVLQLLLLDGFQVSARHQALFDRLAKLEDEPSARQRVCQSLIQKDQTAFDESIGELLLEHERHCAELGATRFVPTAQDRTERYIFVEGLALLRMAEAMGLRTEREYRLMPSLARGGA